MNDIKRSGIDDISTLVESFLYAHPNPTTSHWKELIAANPALAEEVADLALWHGRANRLDDSAYEEALDVDLANSTKSELLSSMHKNTAPVEKAMRALQKCKGPMARNVAREVGLGERVDLLDQAISGEARAPYVIVKRLARKFELQLAAVAEVFATNFQNRTVPAFKSDNKPQVGQEPISWKQAVDAAGIKGEEAQHLLHLEKEMD